MMNKEDKKAEIDNYRFMSETIKPQPFDVSGFLKKAATILAGGVLLCAGVIIALTLFFPNMAEELDVLAKMTDEESEKYLGISGTAIFEKQADKKGIPYGIYVNDVMYDSPAMDAGVQNGDIIHALNEEEAVTVSAYNRILQNLQVGDPVLLSLYRLDAEGQYVDMDLKLIIEEK